MNPTIKTIAKAAGVSPATVSKALNDMPDISETTKERIRQICKEMGYTLNANARNLASGSTRTVGLLVNDVSIHSTGLMIRAIITRMASHGYNVFTCDSERDLRKEQSAITRLLESRVDALIIQPLSHSFSEIAGLVRNAVPIVSIGHESASADAVVQVDEREGGAMIARYLLRLGHRSCAVFTSTSTATPDGYGKRVQGFRDYMIGHGGSAHVLHTPQTGEAAGKHLATRLRASGLRASAVFAVDDLVAIGVLDACRGLGLRVPEDLSLVGYGDDPHASLNLISLTTARLPSMEMGLCVSDVAIDAIAGNKNTLRHFSLAPTLVERATAAAFPE